MRIFVTGYKGQLGQALYAALAEHTLSGCDLPELDITDRQAISAAIAEFAPDVGFNRGGLLLFQDFAFKEKYLDANQPVGRIGFGKSIVDIGAQSVQRYPSFTVPFRARHFSTT